jgi:transcription initiation factor TFIIB
VIRGRSTISILAACLYIACNNESVPRTFKEICAVSSSSKKEIARCFKMIKQEVETHYTSASPTDLIVNFFYIVLKN